MTTRSKASVGQESLPIGDPSVPLEERTARALLTAVTDAGDARVTTAVARHGGVATWRAARAGELGEALARRAEEPAARRVVAALRPGSRLRFVIPGDDEWPERLDDLAGVDSVVPGRGGVPIGLWLRGPGRLERLSAGSLAVVGARACTAYGERVAHDLGYELARAGRPVVSGMAMGIDAAAHRGAMLGGAGTIAVLASGVDVPYPRCNEQLYGVLTDEQLVVSEAAPGLPPTRVGFLARNRIIAALADGTVLVEAGLRSGARNTLNWCSGLGRTGLAVPGPVESALSAGPHAVIRDGQALLVTCAAEVIEAVAPMGSGLLGPSRGPARPVDRLDPATLAVLEALPRRGGRAVGEISLVAGVSVPETLGALGRLESFGLAEPGRLGWQATAAASERNPG